MCFFLVWLKISVNLVISGEPFHCPRVLFSRDLYFIWCRYAVYKWQVQEASHWKWIASSFALKLHNPATLTNIQVLTTASVLPREIWHGKFTLSIPGIHIFPGRWHCYVLVAANVMQYYPIIHEFVFTGCGYLIIYLEKKLWFCVIRIDSVFIRIYTINQSVQIAIEDWSVSIFRRYSFVFEAFWHLSKIEGVFIAKEFRYLWTIVRTAKTDR